MSWPNSGGAFQFRIFLVLQVPLVVQAHLGEVHPPGRHDYFPDLTVSPLNDQIYFQNVLSVVGARDMEEIPDGTGRFLTMRGSNHVKLTSPDHSRELLYLTAGPQGRDDSEGGTSVALHPGFTKSGDPGYGKFYTATIERDLEREVDFQSANPDAFS